MRHKKPRSAAVPRILFALSGVLVAASLYLTWHFGPSGYFAITGRPFHWPGQAKIVVHAQALPVFSTTQSITPASPSRGSAATVSITATSSQTASATVEAWITSPARKQIWRSPDGMLTQFPAGKTVVKTYAYTLPDSLAPGVYKVSAIINSADGDTDYAIHEDFAEFILP